MLQTHALVTSEPSPVNEVPQVDDPEQMEAVEKGKHNRFLPLTLNFDLLVPNR